VKDGDELSNENLETLQAEAYQLMTESEDIIKTKCQDLFQKEKKKLPLISLWEMTLCGGHHVFGTVHCCNVPWWVVHAQILKWEDEGKDKKSIKDDTSTLITKYCFCVNGTKYNGNMSLLAEFLPDVLSINPYVKGDLVIVDNKVAKAENLGDKWGKLLKKSFEKTTSMLQFYEKIQPNNLKNHVDNLLCYFNRVYKYPKVCNHRWGYASDPELIQLLITLLTAIPDIGGGKFSIKFKVDEKIGNYFNVREVSDQIQQTDRFENKDLKEIVEVYPEYFKNINVSSKSDGSKNDDTIMRILQEIYTNNSIKDLRKEVRRQEHSKKRNRNNNTTGDGDDLVNRINTSGSGKSAKTSTPSTDSRADSNVTFGTNGVSNINNGLDNILLLNEIKSLNEMIKNCEESGEDVTEWREIKDFKYSQYRARCGLPPRPPRTNV